jgi:hypothetical protein
MIYDFIIRKMATRKAPKQYGEVIFKNGAALPSNDQVELRRENGILRVPIDLRQKAFETYGDARIQGVLNGCIDLCLDQHISVDEFTILILDKMVSALNKKDDVRDRRLRDENETLKDKLRKSDLENQELKRKLLLQLQQQQGEEQYEEEDDTEEVQEGIAAISAIDVDAQEVPVPIPTMRAPKKPRGKK